MKFTIITHPLSGFQKIKFDLKKGIKFLLGIKTHGPKYVIKNLIEGINELGIEYNLNPNEKNIYEICFIPNGVEALKYTIDLKKKGIIKKIIAGPNITVPINSTDIIFDKNIDIILVPSSWVKNYFLSLKNNEKRIQIWATGNSDFGISKKSKKEIILYKKNIPDNLYVFIKNILNNKKVIYKEIIYGQYQQGEYLNLLNTSIGIIYLQESESQGFSLQEAWTKDIPTLVWNRGYWEYKGIKFYDSKISAPYLEDKSGIFFKSEIDFEEKLNFFIKNIDNFSPRGIYLSNFTNKIASKKLIDIIKSNL